MSVGETGRPDRGQEGVEPGDPPRVTRRLDRPPSDRYRRPDGEAAGAGIAAEPPHGSLVRAAWGGIAASLAGAVLFVIAAGGLSFDWGLIVIAVYIGWSVAVGVSLGGGSSVAPPTRRRLAVGLALLALTLAEVGTWAWARSQGGNLPILEHLWATYGLLVPVQYVAAWLAAAWSGR